MPKPGYVYILASKRNGTLYTGVTSQLIRRVFQHREGVAGGFTRSHHLDVLVYYETFEDIREAIRREKQLKKWERAWKVRLIEEQNPYWRDLFLELWPGAAEPNDAGFPPSRE